MTGVLSLEIPSESGTKIDRHDTAPPVTEGVTVSIDPSYWYPEKMSLISLALYELYLDI